ncbi:MAG: heparan-alpha-glucosaminide N-acetyltransferase domain-containing protein [Actinomycetota bacterium]|nr:heparan-alpha-glucosaminide N-acetyltransferase domain-containing protein [Actinomycetota bacterium]
MRPGRILGLDVARCLALLGMVAVHVLPADSWGHDLAHGRAAALFAVLLGVTASLSSRRKGASAGLAVRAGLIAVVGLVLGELDSGLAVILTYYGLLLLLGLAFLHLKVRALLVVAGFWIVLAPVVSQLVRPALPERTLLVPSFGSLQHPWQLLTELTFTGYYPAVPWLAYLLVGMAVGRMRLTRRAVHAVLLTAGLALAVVAIVVSGALADPADVRAGEAGLFGVTPTGGDWSWLLVATPHSATPFDLAHTVGTALAVIGAGLLVGGVLRDRTERAVAVLFGAGTMTLTLYSLHVVLRTDLFWPPDDDTAASFGWHVLVLVCVGAVFVALDRRGPLEQLVGHAAEAASRWSSQGRVRSRRRP